MMKILTCILLLTIVFPLLGQTPNDSVKVKQEQPTFKNQIDLDVQFLGIDFLYKHRIGKKLFLGAGIGLGGFLNLSSNGTYAEFIRPKIILDYILGQNFHLYQASTYSLLTYDSNRDNYFNTFKFGLGFFFKLSITEVGIETSIIFHEEESGQLLTSLLIIKIPLKRW